MVASMANGRDVAPLSQDDVRLDVMLMSWLEAVRFRCLVLCLTSHFKECFSSTYSILSRFLRRTLVMDME